MTSLHYNWAGNIPFSAARYHSPSTIAQLQEIVHHADKVGIAGARHSFPPIADTTGDLLSLEKLEDAVSIDPTHSKATVSAGMTYETLGPLLHEAGYALPNLASLPHITIAGACATATHGSGEGLGNLATHISGLELVTAGGELVTLTREKDGDTFNGAVVGLGGLGVVARMTLDLIPTFMMQQEIYRGLPLPTLYDNFDAVMASGYSVCLFTDWQKGVIDSAWVKHKLVDDAPIPASEELFGARLGSPEHVLDRPGSDRILTPMSIPGPWYERLIHMTLKHPPGPGDELQTEYFVPRHNAVAAMRKVESLRTYLKPILDLTELRTIAEDALWLSPAYRQDIVAIQFNWHNDGPGVSQFLPMLEEELAPFEARPHWGKLFSTPPVRLKTLYPRLPDFQALARTYDPQGKFRNAFLDETIFEAQ
ncbi:MAG: FAD-binding protein [Chloroflexota bacterium]